MYVGLNANMWNAWKLVVCRLVYQICVFLCVHCTYVELCNEYIHVDYYIDNEAANLQNSTSHMYVGLN